MQVIFSGFSNCFCDKLRIIDKECDYSLMIELNGKTYELIEENKEGFEAEAVKERYSEVLSKYDFIVGDWAYEQLRLKGFYHDNHAKAPIDAKISCFQDYIYEYCNFGCAYFVLKKRQK